MNLYEDLHFKKNIMKTLLLRKAGVKY